MVSKALTWAPPLVHDIPIPHPLFCKKQKLHDNNGNCKKQKLHDDYGNGVDIDYSTMPTLIPFSSFEDMPELKKAQIQLFKMQQFSKRLETVIRVEKWRLYKMRCID